MEKCIGEQGAESESRRDEDDGVCVSEGEVIRSRIDL